MSTGKDMALSAEIFSLGTNGSGPVDSAPPAAGSLPGEVSVDAAGASVLPPACGFDAGSPNAGVR
jgi:hypothetical protein